MDTATPRTATVAAGIQPATGVIAGARCKGQNHMQDDRGSPRNLQGSIRGHYQGGTQNLLKLKRNR